MKRILVTGATGFIGCHTLRGLVDRGFEVHAISRRASSALNRIVTWHDYDLLEDRACDDLLKTIRATHLLHLAWDTEPGLYWTSPANLMWVAASLQLVMAFPAYGGRRLVLAGTCAEYDWNYGFCSELVTPARPATLYGKSKHALGELVDGFAEHASLSVAWGRIFFLYGPHEHHSRLVPSIISALLRGEQALCTHGQQIRDFLFVQDVANAFVELVESDVTGVVNIGSGCPIRVRDIVAEIGRQLGREDLLCFGAKQPAPPEPPLLVADNRRLTREVGWKQTYELAHGLAETIRWWQTHGV